VESGTIDKLIYSLTFALGCWVPSAVIAEEGIVAPPSSVAIKQASDYSMSHSGQTFIVMFEGKFVAEEYAGGGATDRLQILASGSNTITPDEFVNRWKDSGGAELANSQSFLKEMCDLLDVPHPEPSRPDSASNQYVFEKAVEFNNGDGSVSFGRVDLFHAGCFVPESKQGSERKAAEQADVTRDIATRLAKLAKSLEAGSASGAGHDPEVVAGFLMRCLFTMFAEDVELIRKNSFSELLLSLRFEIKNFQPMVESLWEASCGRSDRVRH